MSFNHQLTYLFASVQTKISNTNFFTSHLETKLALTKTHVRTVTLFVVLLFNAGPISLILNVFYSIKKYAAFLKSHC